MAENEIDKKFIDFEVALRLYFSKYIKDEVINIANKANKDLSKKNDKSLESLMPNDISSYMAANKYNLERETIDDVINDIKQKVINSKEIKKDLGVFKDEFKALAIDQIGKQKYDKASSLISKDLSLDYIERRTQEFIEDYIASLNAPSSFIQYLIHRLNNESLFSFISLSTCLDNKTKKENEIQKKAIEKYNPSLKEKTLSTLGVTLFDALSLSPLSPSIALSSSLIDLGVNTSKEVLNNLENKPLRDDEYLSIVLFNGKTNVFDKIKGEAQNNSFSSNFSFINEKLENKIPEFHPTLLSNLKKEGFIKDLKSKEKKEDSFNEEVPIIIAKEKKEEYLKSKLQEKKDFLNSYIGKELIEKKTKAKIVILEIKNDKLIYSYFLNENTLEKEVSLKKAYDNIKEGNWISDLKKEDEIKGAKEKEKIGNPQEKSLNEFSFFSDILKSFGTDSLKNTFQNLPYILATLPDTLFKTVKGTNDAINLKRDILPLSFFTLGILIKNPLLKALFLGFGGINLLSKLGNSTLKQANKKYNQNTSFIKEYKDEKLDYRLKDVRIKDNKFIITINGTPYFTYLPDITAKAYKEGKLPLNTLANAVFKEYNRRSSLGLFQDEISSSIIKENQNQKESIALSR